MNAFDRAVCSVQRDTLRSEDVRIVQVNLGLLCNMACRHCHVEGSPQRSEIMSLETMQSLLRLLKFLPGVQVDLTGGAPEMNPHFKFLVEALRAAGHPVQVRTNLTVFFEKGQETTPEFLESRSVQLVASLPCYLDDNVDAQRGSDVYRRSIAALRRLNALGYGRREDRPLNLVYNPGGAFLPPEQQKLEAAYRRELKDRHGIVFSRLLTITNMPLGRFFRDLKEAGKADIYQALLREQFNGATLDGLMCRHQVSVSWDGTLSDCDFNSVLGLPLASGLPSHVDQVEPGQLHSRPIVTGEHCFGCTAGSGSSCGGALVA